MNHDGTATAITISTARPVKSHSPMRIEKASQTDRTHSTASMANAINRRSGRGKSANRRKAITTEVSIAEGTSERLFIASETNRAARASIMIPGRLSADLILCHVKL